MHFTIHPFDPHNADESTFQALNELMNVILDERDPDRRHTPVSETKARYLNYPSYVRPAWWVVTTPEPRGYVAFAEVATLHETGHNEHLAQFTIRVLPAWRRQGIGTALLDQVISVAEERDRRLVLTDTTSRVPAGNHFVTRFGLQKAMVQRTSQLDLAAVDHDLLRRWQQRAAERASDYELVLWEGAYPAGIIDDIVRMKQVMNTAPLEDLDVEEFKLTAEEVQEQDTQLAAREITRHTMAARHRESGAIGGYTEIYHTPHQPDTVSQGDTAVFPEVRGRGLGRWLKAAMLEHLLETFPEAKRVRTGNAQSNAPMLKINEEMGFRLWKEETAWQADTATVREALTAASS